MSWFGFGVWLNGEGLDSKCKNLFGPDKVVDVKMLYDYIVKNIKDLSLDYFCKLYLLLGIFEFLLPNQSGRMFSILFKIVDDLPSIGKYKWGGVVYKYLVQIILSIWFKAFLKLKCYCGTNQLPNNSI